MLVLVFARLRRLKRDRGAIWLPSVMGTGLILVSLFPGLANVPADLLFLGDMQGGRIITLLLVALGLIVPVILHESDRLNRLKDQLDAVVRTTAARELLQRDPLAITPDSVLVVIPAFNEADNLRAVLPRVPNAVRQHPVRVLVVDDGSEDGTAKVAEECGALVVQHPINRGGGAALRTGYEIAYQTGVSVVVTMDGDGQHDPKEVADLVAPILDDHCDVVIGSRILGSHHVVSLSRTLGLRAFGLLLNLLVGTRTTDCASGFRAFRSPQLSNIRLTQDQYHTAELVIEAGKRGLRVEERPIHIARRLSGESKKGGELLYGIGFLRTVLATWLR